MKSKVCLITGADSEIACDTAEVLSQEYLLILCCHRGHERSDRLMKTFDTVPYQADLTDEVQAGTLMHEVFRKYSHIDLLVNFTGKNIHVPDDDINGAVWDDVISANLKPAFFLCKYYRKYCKKDLDGCIINFSSTAGIRPILSSPHYIAAKAGLIALSKYYAAIMAPNVRVNIIAPSFVKTERHNFPEYDSVREKIPLKRMADPSEIAKTVMYLANCRYITGQTVILDGGMTI